MTISNIYKRYRFPTEIIQFFSMAASSRQANQNSLISKEG